MANTSRGNGPAIAAYIAGAPQRVLPPEVADLARLCLADWLGVAIGAGIAASLPPTELETEYFGEASDRLKDKVQEFASDQAQQAKAVAEEAAQAAAGEARRQGLDPGALKSAVADAGARVRNVAGAATDSIKQRANQG